MDYREKFYANYNKTHIKSRKGEVTLASLKSQTIAMRQTLGPFVPEDRKSRIADMGCGFGKVVFWLQQDGYEKVVGVDVSEDQIAVGLGLGIGNLHQEKLMPFLWRHAAALDAIILRDVLEHFHKDEILDILQAVLEALVPGGRVIIQVPNGESPFHGRIRYGDFTHEMAFTASSLSQLFNVMGFAEHSCHEIPPVFPKRRFSPKTLIRRACWRIARNWHSFLLFSELGRRDRRILTQNILAVAYKG